MRTVSLYRTAEGRFMLVLDQRMVVQSTNLFLRFNTLKDVGEYLGRDDGDLARDLLDGVADSPEPGPRASAWNGK